MDLTGSKILAMCLLGGISIFLGFIPLKLGKLFKGRDGSPRHGTIFSGLLCFGGGVLLGTSLLHLLPEVIKIDNYFKKGQHFGKGPMICNIYHIKVYVFSRSEKILNMQEFYQRSMSISRWVKSY